jgi:anti-anti-sigma regulatory factor
LATLRNSSKQDGVGVVELAGQLTEDARTERLEEWLEEHFVDDGVSVIRVDLSEVTRIDLEGVAALGLLAAEAVRRDKVFLIDGPSGQVRDKLVETGLLPYLEAKEGR